MPRRRRGQPLPIDRLAQGRDDRAAVIERASQAVAEGTRRRGQSQSARRRRHWKREWREGLIAQIEQDVTHYMTGTVFQPTPAYQTPGTLANTYYANNLWDTTNITAATSITAATIVPSNTWWQATVSTSYVNPCTAVFETEDERYEREANQYEDALYERYREDGVMPDRDVFDAWWDEARQQRLAALWQKEKAWRRWMATGCDPEVRVKPVPDYGPPPYGGDQEGQERGFIRRIYGVGVDGRRRCWEGEHLPTAEQVVQLNYARCEVVWYRFEVPFETGVPRFVKMDGRPTTAERRQYRRVQKRQEELRLARAEIARLEQEEQNRLNAEADTRALSLLLTHLNEVQRKEWEEHRHFHVHLTRESVMAGQRGEVVTYRIEDRGQAGNVYRIANGRKVERFCIHPYGGGEPNPDVYLMQMLLLEENEAEFRRVANITHIDAAA